LQAAAIGAAAVVPLSIKLEDLHLLGEIATGAEATVLYGSLHDGTDVAVKRFKIHQADDLKRFRR
jgi:serine/threonine-protein kinase RIO1